MEISRNFDILTLEYQATTFILKSHLWILVFAVYMNPPPNPGLSFSYKTLTNVPVLELQVKNNHLIPMA